MRKVYRRLLVLIEGFGNCTDWKGMGKESSRHLLFCVVAWPALSYFLCSHSSRCIIFIYRRHARSSEMDFKPTHVASCIFIRFSSRLPFLGSFIIYLPRGTLFQQTLFMGGIRTWGLERYCCVSNPSRKQAAGRISCQRLLPRLPSAKMLHWR